MIALRASDHLLTTRCLPLTIMLYNIFYFVFFVCNDNELYRMRPDRRMRAPSSSLDPQLHSKPSNFVSDGREF
jgi:hypothetical protein